MQSSWSSGPNMDITISEIITRWINENGLSSHFRVATEKDVAAIFCACESSYFPIVFLNDERATDFDAFDINICDPDFFNKLRLMMIVNHNNLLSHCI